MNKIEYYSGIKGYIASRIKNPDDAEDITQQVFLNFYNFNNRNVKLENPRAYIFKIARRLISDYYQQKKKESDFLIKIPQIDNKVSNNSNIKDLQKNELTEEIDKYVSQLPPKIRKALELKLIFHLSNKTASKKAGCSIQRLYKRFYKGLNFLRTNLDIK